MKRKSALFFLLYFATLLPASSQQYYFKKYQVEDGLSHNTVWSILQDSYGFIWFGTSDGLNRFDGQHFKTYKSDIKDKQSLGNNSIRTLYEDENKDIWIGTSNGIFIFDHIRETFYPFDVKTQFGVAISSEVKKIIKSKKEQIWIATLGQGFFVYDIHSGTLTQNSQYTSFVWDIAEDITNRIYISSLQEGLICFDQNGKLIESYTSFLNDKNRSNSKINCIQNIHEKIWFSVGINNLSCLDGKTGEIQLFNNECLSVGAIRCIVQYSDRELMLGSDNGLYLFDILTEQFTRIDSPVTLRGLSDQSIYAILKDKEGGFWISTYLGGINYLAQQTKKIEYYYPVYHSTQAIGKVINRFYEDKNRNIWVASQNELRVLDNKTQTIETYTLPGTYDIRALLVDDDHLWIGTFGDGLKVIDLKTKKLKEYRHQQQIPNTICSNDVLSLYKDKSGNIYVGTTWGMCLYNRESDDFSILNYVGSMVTVLDILEDSKGYLWIATLNSGVFRYNLSNKHWIHFVHKQEDPHSFNSNTVISLFEDSKGKMWFGMDGGGLCYYEKDGDADIFVDFDPDNILLPNKVIYSIEEDNMGNFWISTNSGLLRIDPDSTDNRKLFTQEDGLQGNQFNAKASLKAGNGKLYFGGINGFNAFFPDEFKDNNYIPPVYIVDIQILDRSNHNTKKNIRFAQPLHLSEKITLPHTQSSFLLEFIALSYENNKRNKYAYKLDGIDTDWIYTSSNTASYTNLSSGEYTFHLKAANNDGIWNEQGISLTIKIDPPWWFSVWVILLYIVLFLSFVYFLIKYITKKTNKKIQQKMEVFHTQKEKEIYQSKISFFVNLVHEIRTPLSLIKLPLEKLSENEGANKYLTIVNKNIDYLLNVVNQLLDFQKIEHQKKKPNITNQDIQVLMQDIYEQFSHYASLHSIQLNLQLPEESAVVTMDKEMVNKIIVNLLSNALKYAKSLINLRLECFDNRFEISVEDDGPGVADNEKAKIFEAFYQTNESTNTGTGIGLAYSKLLAENHSGTLSLSDNEYGGSTFKLLIPSNTGLVSVGKRAVENIIDRDQAEEVLTEKSNFKSCRLLLVEDNVELLNLVSDLLKEYFIVIKATDGRKALEKLTHEAIDIIVCDIMMPDINGLELCAKVKSDINVCHIPVILLTAKADIDSKIEGLEYGADVYIEKPFSIKYLRMQIENLLKLRLSFQKLMLTMPAMARTEVTSNKDKEFLSKLQAEIDKHIAELDFSIDHIAETMFMSRSNFYRKIKAISGMAPNDYLKAIRLNKAAELLEEGDVRINEVLERVGFGSSSYFAKCFKAQFGVLPKEFLEKKQAENEN
jgi:signal transduction histidine kinase/ligand-binding sensor domain-containing protein/DNA-binding response OmpR family regulator